MEQILEAIYQNGVLTPLEPLNLEERQRVVITIRLLPSDEADKSEKTLKAWQQVYVGLSEEEITEIEQIALDRSKQTSATAP